MNRGRARPLRLVAEGMAMAAAQPVSSVLVAVIVGAVCAGVLATSGQTAAQEAAVLSQIDDAGTRSITVTDSRGGGGFAPEAVGRVASLSGVEWVLGLGSVVDVRNAALRGGGEPVSARVAFGPPPSALRLVDGRWPASGEAVVGQAVLSRLSMAVASGSVSGAGQAEIPVVGSFAATGPLAPLASSVLIGATPAEGEVRTILLLAASPSDIEPLTGAVVEVASPSDRSTVQVETSATLADVRRAVAGELGRFSRRLVVAALAGGLVLTGVTVMAAVSLRRRDFGRRRALGASRSAIVGLVLTQTAAGAACGAAAGTAVGLIAVRRLAGADPPSAFVAGVAVLAMLAALAASVVPSVVAAARDPVRVLRVP